MMMCYSRSINIVMSVVHNLLAIGIGFAIMNKTITMTCRKNANTYIFRVELLVGKIIALVIEIPIRLPTSTALKAWSRTFRVG